MKFFIFLILFSTSNLVFCETTKDSKDLNDNFMCRRVMGTDLKKLKELLIQECDLNKPFAKSWGKLGLENGYTYCCHKK
jgi:hypothetical protein